jgi:hypothetical protein
MRVVPSAVFALVLFTAGASFAQSPDEVSRARALALEALENIKSNDYKAAIEKVTEAEKLYHAPTHILILAQAQEGLGHLADAAATYDRLIAEPLPESAPEPFRKAQGTAKERLRVLLARVPSVLVAVKGVSPSKASGTIDGKKIDLAAESAIRLDPGEHAIRVEAPGREPFERTVTLPEKGGVVVVEATLAGSGGPEDEKPKGGDVAPVKTSSAGRGAGIVLIGLGVAGVGVGAVTGILSLGKVSDIDSKCPNKHCTPEEQSDIDSAKTMGTVSTIGFIAGGVGLVAGVVLLVATGRGGASTAPASAKVSHVTPWAGLGSAGFSGRF